MTTQIKNYILIGLVAVALALWAFGQVEITVIITGLTALWQFFEARFESQAHTKTKKEKEFFANELRKK